MKIGRNGVCPKNWAEVRIEEIARFHSKRSRWEEKSNALSLMSGDLSSSCSANQLFIKISASGPGTTWKDETEIRLMMFSVHRQSPVTWIWSINHCRTVNWRRREDRFQPMHRSFRYPSKGFLKCIGIDDVDFVFYFFQNRSRSPSMLEKKILPKENIIRPSPIRDRSIDLRPNHHKCDHRCTKHLCLSNVSFQLDRWDFPTDSSTNEESNIGPQLTST